MSLIFSRLSLFSTISIISQHHKYYLNWDLAGIDGKGDLLPGHLAETVIGQDHPGACILKGYTADKQTPGKLLLNC